MDTQYFNASHVMQTIRSLSVEIGPRFSGSPNCLRAGDHIEAFFRGLGLETSRQSFDVPLGTLEEHRLEVLQPEMGAVPCVPFYFLCDTPPEGITAEVVYLESMDFLPPAPALEGKIVLLPAAALGSTRQPYRLFEQRPAALLVISGDPGFGPRHDVADEIFYKPFDPVPAFRIAWEDGYRLVQGGAQRARLVLRTTRGSGRGHNIIADLPGTHFPDEMVVICGHYDSPPDTPSATDNASGTAMMMELARIYARKGCRRSLRFIAMDAEERGLVGSRTYARALYHQHAAEKKPGFEGRAAKTLFEKHLLCINLDVLGMALGQHACYVIGPAELAACLRVLGLELGVPQQVITDSLYGSDHEALGRAGIPAVDFSRIGPSMRYIHTDADTPDLIHPARLQEVGGMLETFLERYANRAAAWPFERRIPADQEGLLRQKFEEYYRWKPEEEAGEKNEH